MLPSRLWIAVVLIVASPALASAQIRFSQPTANLGELRGGPVYQHRFDFVNDAAQAIEVTDIRLGCGCLQAVLEQRRYQPGEKGTLLLNLRTLGQPNGSRTWNAHVQYRHAGKVGEVALIVGAAIRNEVTIEPSILAVTVETALKQEVTIKDHRQKALKVVTVLASSSAIRVSTQPAVAGVTKVTLEISRAAMTAARQEETLNIYTDDPNYRHLQVPITLMRANRAEVNATPDKVEISGAGSRLVRLRATGGQPLRIADVKTNNAGIACKWAAGPSNDITLKVSVDASARLQSPSTPPCVYVRFLSPADATLAIPVVLSNE